MEAIVFSAWCCKCRKSGEDKGDNVGSGEVNKHEHISTSIPSTHMTAQDIQGGQLPAWQISAQMSGQLTNICCYACPLDKYLPWCLATWQISAVMPDHLTNICRNVWPLDTDQYLTNIARVTNRGLAASEAGPNERGTWQCSLADRLLLVSRFPGAQCHQHTARHCQPNGHRKIFVKLSDNKWHLDTLQ